MIRSPEVARAGGTGSGPHTQDETLAATHAGEGGPPRAAPPVRGGLPQKIGRYAVLSRIGSGGMGVVFSAFDETLGRRVAIKLLRMLDSSSGRERLRREAQALARLSHPNVVQVYEFGESERGEHYLVMEFVDGRTLGEWREQTQPSRAQILAVFAAAGRGLAAAHAKGLVHRDFKPDNVMIASDGRVLVMDFGIAHGEALGPSPEPQPQPQPGLQSDAVVDLTATGALMGTPAYMAPEQFHGQRADERSDQFSYCVALFEALYGVRPFSAPTLMQLAARVSEGRPELPTQHEVPPWLRDLLLRGLASEPGARFPSMDALLDALSNDPTWRRRALLVAALALVLLVVGALSLRLQRHQQLQAHEQACASEAASIEELWDEGVQQRLSELFAAGGHAAAPESFARTAARMSDYASAWREARRASCLDAGPEGQEDERALACLDERRASFGALLAAWSELDQLDPDLLSEAPLAAANLPPISSCSEEAWLGQRVVPPADSELREQVLQLRTRLTELEALRLSKRDEDALAAAEQLLEQVEALGWQPLSAEVHLAIGYAKTGIGDYSGAQTQLERALLDAVESGHLLVELEASTMLAATIGYYLGKPEQGRFWLNYSDRLLARAGLEGTTYEVTKLNFEGNIAWSQRELDTAQRAYARAYDINLAKLGEQHPSVAASLAFVGYIRMERGDYEQALADYERALAQQVELLGPEHIAAVSTVAYIADLYQRRKDYDEALVRQREVLEAYTRIYGESHPAIASTESNIGYILVELGRAREAVPVLQHAVELHTESLGAEHPATERTRRLLSKARGEDPDELEPAR